MKTPRFQIPFLTGLLLVSLSPFSVPHAAAATPARPNFLLILADDLGWSDLGCYGGEIRTPTLDALAAGGVRFTQFYNTSRCCPSRASLLTGLYPHQAHVGNMTADRGPEFPGYRGTLQADTVTLAESPQEVLGNWHDVGAALAQWRKPHSKHVQAEQQVLTEAASLDLGVDRDSLPPPHARRWPASYARRRDAAHGPRAREE